MVSLASPAVANTTSAGAGLESSAQLVDDRLNLIAATTVPAAAYGITSMLYCMSIYYLFKKFLRFYTPCSQPLSLSRSKKEWRMTLFYILYTSVLFILVSLYTAGNSQDAIIAFVDNRLYPQGPYQYYLAYMAGQPVMVMVDVASTLILWLTDGLILCRFIVFYYRVPYARWIIPLPCAMYVGTVVFSALLLRSEASFGRIFLFSEDLILVYYVLSFSMNVLTTVLIAARLYWHKLQLQRIFGSRRGSPYMTIATVLIESAALYGAWSVAFMVLYALSNPGQTFIMVTMAHVQVIAPLLIIMWTARGKAWDSARSYGEDERTRTDEAGDPDHAGSVRGGLVAKLGRLVGGGKGDRTPVPVVIKDVHVEMDPPRNASWSTVIAGDEETKHPDAIELEPCAPELPTLAHDGAKA